MKDVIEKLKQNPDFPCILEELNAFWAQEKAKRQEFYNLVHEDTKAEFINGEIVFHSPVRSQHWIACTNIAAYLTVYVNQHQLGKIGVEKVMIRCTRNDYEPDVVFFDQEQAATFTPDQLLFPPPRLVVEVLSESTRKNDYGVKFRDYAEHGVAEYWIVDTEQKTVEQYLLDGKTFQLHQKLSRQGELRTDTVAGFSMDIRAIFS